VTVDNDAISVTEGVSETVADPRRWVVLSVLCLALLVVGIDGTIVNVALPSLVRELHATSSQLQWIVDAYTIVFGLLLIGGNTGDRLGRAVLVVGLVIRPRSLGCSMVGTAEGLDPAARVWGLGAALIMPATLSILTNVFTDPAERGRAIGLWAGISRARGGDRPAGRRVPAGALLWGRCSW
jgi:MFS family permease